MSARLSCTHPHQNSCVCCAARRVYQCPIPDGVWEMTKTVYGLEEAPPDFDEHFGKVSGDLCDEFGSLCLTRLASELAAFHSKLTSCHDVQTHGRRCVGWSR